MDSPTRWCLHRAGATRVEYETGHFIFHGDRTLYLLPTASDTASDTRLTASCVAGTFNCYARAIHPTGPSAHRRGAAAPRITGLIPRPLHPPTDPTMTYAVFETGGKQFRAEPGTKLRVPSLEAEAGSEVTFDRVLLAAGDDEVRVGAPTVEGASVKAEVVRHGKADKVIVFKRKRRKGYRRKQGHRQGFTEVRVEEVSI